MRGISLILLIWLALAFNLKLEAQYFIGLHKDEIEYQMKESFGNFRLNRDLVNKHYKYIKYEDFVSDQTALFFLSESETCTYVRWMSDYSNISEIKAYLDKNYRKVDNSGWEYSYKGKSYKVTLEKGDWYFTVTHQQK